jgi:acetate---CoA ligase (ADP-forming) subunit beta
MLNKEIQNILEAAGKTGWVVEPEAKKLLSLAGLNVPRFTWATRLDEAQQFAHTIGYPVVVKVVSSEILHKSDVGGVVVGIDADEKLSAAFQRFSKLSGFAGMVVEETVSGVELIIGAKVDYQFGPIILLGIGGTGVEIYQDKCLRMAPLQQGEAETMIKSLKAHQLLEGYRGSKPVCVSALTLMLDAFSDLIMQLEDHIESIDLNPVMCSVDTCVIADARILLHSK